MRCRSFRVTPLRFPSAAIGHTDENYFLEGFSVAEKRLRWTRAATAALAYPLARVESVPEYELRLRAGAYQRQRVRVLVNDGLVADWQLEGMDPETRRARFSAGLLSAGANRVELRLSDALLQSPPGDSRRLGLAFVSLRIFALRPASPE